MPTAKMTPVPADGWADPITEPSSRQPSRERLVMEIDWLPDTENTHHRESRRIKWMYTPNSLQIALPHPLNISPYYLFFFIDADCPYVQHSWLGYGAEAVACHHIAASCVMRDLSCWSLCLIRRLSTWGERLTFYDFLFALSPAGNGRTAFKLILVHQNKKISGSLCNMK